MKRLTQLFAYSIVLALTGCGIVGFENSNNVAVRKHNEAINKADYSTVTASDGLVEITRTVRYKAIITADQKQDVSQQDVDASSKVDIKLAISRYLAAILSSGGSELVSVIDAFSTKPAESLTAEEALALAITANKSNNNKEPSVPTIMTAIQDYIKVAKSEEAKTAAKELLNKISEKETTK